MTTSMSPHDIEPASTEVSFPSLDGLVLQGTVVRPRRVAGVPAVLIHGGGVTREEGGFFARLAMGLASVGRTSLRFDLRGHGHSDGRQEDLTLSGILNDIRSAAEYVTAETGSENCDLIGASFGGGISAYYAATNAGIVRRLVLLNPLLNYKKRFIDDKPYWSHDRLQPEAADDLTRNGFLAHSPTFKLGRALLNEVFYIRPHEALDQIRAPTLFIHGTGDTFIPVESSRNAVRQITGDARLVEIDGAQHGLAVHDDPQYRNPQTQEWQAFVVQEVSSWLSQD